MKNKLISLKKIERMAGLAFENCIRLHQDSITLFQNGSYPSAFFLSVIALEEYGKVLWLADLSFRTSVGEMDRSSQEKWIESIFLHKRKQGIFAHEFKFNLPQSHLKMIYEQKIESEKQNSIYVGLPKKDNKIQMGGRLITPFKLPFQKAKKQISILQEALVLSILGNIKGIYSIDSDAVSKLMTRVLFSSLMLNWEYISPKTKKKIAEFEKFDDDNE